MGLEIRFDTASPNLTRPFRFTLAGDLNLNKIKRKLFVPNPKDSNTLRTEDFEFSGKSQEINKVTTKAAKVQILNFPGKVKK